MSANGALLLLTGSNEIVTAPRPELAGIERELLDRQYLAIGEPAYEAWRVARGEARMGVDFPAGALPAEAGLEHAIDSRRVLLGAGVCGEGAQPRTSSTVLRHGWTRTATRVGAPVHFANDEVGSITSVAPRRAGGTALIARLTWTAAGRELTIGGSPLIHMAD